MRIRLHDGLPLVSVTLGHRGQQIELEDVLLDTGSASTVFSADRVASIGLEYGFQLDGILGMDFLVEVGAIIDLHNAEIHRWEMGDGRQ